MRKRILCVLEKPYTDDKKEVGDYWQYGTEETMNFENYSYKILRRTFPESDFELFSTNVDNRLGNSAKSKSNKMNANVPDLMKKKRISTVAFCGRKAERYYYTVKDEIKGNVILMPHPRSSLLTIKKREALTKAARKNSSFVSFW